MRLDDIAPRTLLLGVLAAWAVAAWMLAMAGMGGSVPGPEPGAVPPPQLPKRPAGTAPGVGPAGQYATIASRPLFATDRRPKPFVLQTATGAPADAPAFDLVLSSVLITPQAVLAIVQKPDGSESWRLRVGESPEPFPAWRLASVAPRAATFSGPEGDKVLELRVFNGQGGSQPTSVVQETPGRVEGPMPVPPPPPMPAPTPAPPPTDASTAPDPQEIEAIRRRIEARREQMRQRAQNAPPSSAVAPPTR